MLTYKSLEIVNEGSKDQSNEKSNDITHNHIENMQKNFRSHRAALDFDKGFIVASLTSGKDRKMIHKIKSQLQDYSHQAFADVAHTRCRHCQRRAIALPTAAEAGTAAAPPPSAAEPPPSFHRRRAGALPPPPTRNGHIPAIGGGRGPGVYFFPFQLETKPAESSRRHP